jgi:hypothetical protein
MMPSNLHNFIHKKVFVFYLFVLIANTFNVNPSWPPTNNKCCVAMIFSYGNNPHKFDGFFKNHLQNVSPKVWTHCWTISHHGFKGWSFHDSLPSMTILKHKHIDTTNSHNYWKKWKESQHEECHTISLLFAFCFVQGWTLRTKLTKASKLASS